MLRRWLLGFAVLAVLLGNGGAHAAERYALLVGASKYDNLAPEYQLVGPRNDVALVAGVLAENGFAAPNIQILAEPPVGQARPTRDGIMGALEALASRVGAGDFVYLHFSGHGSQQPTRKAGAGAARETDGLDEIFLPADVGAWDDGVGAVARAISDDDMGAAIAKLRRRGAFVWAVFDSCHSGTMTRGVPVADVRLRKVEPAALGVPAGADRGAAGPAEASPAPALALGPDAGGYVAFFAAQSTEKTPEMRLPQGDPASKPYGLFTYTLMTALAASPGASYRQVGQQILQAYAADNRGTYGPLFEGPGLDAPAFGSEARERVRQWRVSRTADGLQIAAGSLHRLRQGSVLALVPGPTASAADVLGHVRVDSAEVMRSIAHPFAFDDKPAVALDQVPEHAYARLVRANLALELGIARPRLGEPPSEAEARLRDALAALQAEAESDPEAPALHWLEPGDDADLRLMVESGGAGPTLWLLPPSGELVREGPTKTHSIALTAGPEELRGKLRTSFARIAKVTNLLRLADGLAQGAGRPTLEFSIVVTRAKGGNEERFRAHQVPTLYAGDAVKLLIRNHGSKPIDVTMLDIDGAYGISAIFPDGPDEINRIEAGGTHVIEATVNDKSLGLERLLIIAVAAQPNTPHLNLSFLAQPRLERTRGTAADPARAVDPARADIYDMFLAAGFGRGRTRGSLNVRRRAASQAEMQLFTWRTEARR